VIRMPMLRAFARDFVAFFRRMDWLTDFGRKVVTQKQYESFVRKEFGR